jgi:hypothetical protein
MIGTESLLFRRAMYTLSRGSRVVVCSNEPVIRYGDNGDSWTLDDDNEFDKNKENGDTAKSKVCNASSEDFVPVFEHVWLKMLRQSFY